MKNFYALRAALLLAPLLLGSVCANAQISTGMPSPGKAGKFNGPAVELPPAGSLSGQRAAAVLAALPKASGETTRGGAEAALYRRLSPSVVLIVTEDGLGSGSFITKDGEIITAYHVVGKNKTVGIVMKPLKADEKPDPSQLLTADVLRYDGVTDLALLKLRLPPGMSVTPIPLGDFAKVNIGDDVSAIGHPEGEVWTFTKGLVSQIRRNYDFVANDHVETKADMIQTQTPINPGNSGGPLLNSAGQIIGINDMVFEGEQGLNFAVAVDEVQRFLAGSGNREPIAAAKAEPADSKQAQNQPGDTKNSAVGPLPVPPTCKPQLLFEGRDDKNAGSMRRYDMLCSGQATLALYLPDDKTKPMLALFAGKSGKLAGIAYSMKRDGYWNISYWDSKDSGTEKWDTIGYHPDGKLTPTSYGPYVPPKSAN